MVNNASDEYLGKLSKLSKQERQVLELRCQGLDYKTIGSRLFISVSAVKQYMSRIYVKLGLDILPRAERTKVLYETFCPLLQRLNEKPGQITEGTDEVSVGEEIPEAQPLLIPAYVEDMVDDDEYPIIQVTTKQITKPSKTTRKQSGKGTIFLFIGVVLGTCLSALVYILIPQPAPTTSIPTVVIPTITVVPTKTDVPTETQIPSATPDIPTQTPVVIQQVVVVTATSLPATITPIPTPTQEIYLPFSDNFDQGISPAWKMFGDDWLVSNGKLTLSTNGAFKDYYEWVELGDSSWKDYTLSVDIQTSINHLSQFGIEAIIVRKGTQSKSIGVYVDSMHQIYWAYFDSNSPNPLPISGTNNEFPQEGKVTIAIQGNNYSLKMNGSNVQTITLTGYDSGGIALGMVCRYGMQCPSFDNFEISTP